MQSVQQIRAELKVVQIIINWAIWITWAIYNGSCGFHPHPNLSESNTDIHGSIT